MSDWESIAGHLPDDLDGIAASTGALKRKRGIRSAEDMVRLSLVYAMDDMSLRDSSVWASEAGIGELSDVAILKRLRKAVPFLREVCSRMIARPAVESGDFVLRLIDATTISRHRASGTDFRVHMSYSPRLGQFTGVQLTRANEGERLDRLECGTSDVLVADMGYQGRRGMASVRARGADFVVRFYPRELPLENERGERLDPFALAERLEVGELLDLPVWTISGKNVPSVSGRMIVVRKPDAKVEEGLKKKRKAKGKDLSDEAIRAERYVMLFTTLEAHRADTLTVLEIYRARWQVEMLFKRIKGIVSLGETLARDMELCECIVLGKLLTLLLIQAFESAFFPWGYPLRRREPLPAA